MHNPYEAPQAKLVDSTKSEPQAISRAVQTWYFLTELTVYALAGFLFKADQDFVQQKSATLIFANWLLIFEGIVRGCRMRSIQFVLLQFGMLFLGMLLLTVMKFMA